MRHDTRGQRATPGDPALREFCIYAVWHESIFVLDRLHQGAPSTVLLSQHRDADVAAEACRRAGVRVIRGSSTRGGAMALEQLVGECDGSHLLITPDGPQGPRREVKRGLIYLASWTGRPIVPVGIGFRRAWRAKSWDRFAVPWPGSLVTCVAGEMLRVPQQVNRAGLDRCCELLQQSMDEATEAAQRWAKGGPRPAPLVLSQRAA